MSEPLTFELHRETVPGLADLGERVELREIPYGAVKRAMGSADRGMVGEALLGAALFVDGTAIGIDAVLDLPGRYSSAIADALARCLEIHGLRRGADDADAPNAEDADRPGEA